MMVSVLRTIPFWSLLLAVGACRTDGATTPPGAPDVGANASLNGRRPFPDDNPWNTAVDGAAVDPNSAALIASIGLTTGLHPDFGASYLGGPFGIPYVVVAGGTPPVNVTFSYADESDPGPYPIPPDAPIEGGSGSSGDRHVLVIDRDRWKLYELFSAYPVPSSSSWTAGSGAIFDLSSDALRPAGWTSADAAGLPIFPGLVRYDEVVQRGRSATPCVSPWFTHAAPTCIPPVTGPAPTRAQAGPRWGCASG